MQPLRAKIITHRELMRRGYRIWYPEPTLPRSLDDAAGMLKDEYDDLKKHYQKIRKEWPSYR